MRPLTIEEHKTNKKARDRGFKKEREEGTNEFTKRNCFVKENVID